MKRKFNNIIERVKQCSNFIKELIVELQPLIIIYLIIELLKLQ